jgi:hypothetical protein
MTQVRGQFAQLMKPGLKMIYDDASQFEQRAEEYPMVFNTKSSEDAYEQEAEFSALGPLQEKPENTGTIYNDMIEGGTKRYVHLTYSLGVRTSKELWDDAKYDLIKQGPRALARSTRFTKEVVAWYTFNQGFSNAVQTIDGLSLFNSQHSLLGGAAATNLGPGLAGVVYAAGTYPNRPNPDIDFSLAGLQLMTNHGNRMIDNQGFPINMRFKNIIIPPELVFIAREILGSPGKPGTSDNDINSILAEDYKFMVCHYLNSPAAWYATAEKSEHTAVFYTREAPKTTFDDDFDTDAIKQKTRMRISSGVSRWQGLWASQAP